MSIRRILSVVVFAVVAAVLVALRTGHWSASAGRGDWNHGALRATLERVVPAHNDAFFVYQLENRTNADYRVTSSDVQILGRHRTTGDLMAATGAHVSGEFPLLVPARRKVHFALIWTADRDIEPSHMDDFVRTLNVRSFVLFDHKHRYQLDFPAKE